MGDMAEEILSFFKISAEDARKYKTVKEQFDHHLVKPVKCCV